jgi:alkylhydroperoxidase/carboxymuconolactone decarboxylase family protein YurZ
MSSDRLAHYRETMDTVPVPITAMFQMDPEFAGHYTDIRELIYREREDGLSLAVKELILVLLDVAVSNKDGAINHLRAARRAGVTKTQLQEMLIEAFLVLGVSGWGKVGHHLWTEWEREDGA